MADDETPSSSALHSDRGLPLGNSLDADARRALHVKIKNRADEPIIVDMTGVMGFSNGTPAPVSVTNASVIVLPANMTRKYARFSNYSGHTIWLQYEIDAAPDTGIRLQTGSTWTITTFELWLGDVYAVTEGPTLTLEVMEGT